MKLTNTTALALALMALSATRTLKRHDIIAATDTLLFTDSLPVFIAARDAQDPSTLDWASDGCTASPDNPLGFDFTPACYRHDFGYRNYKLQARFTETARAAIDNIFETDMYYQCSHEFFEDVCRATADVYYAAVVAFGGWDATPGRRAEGDLVSVYEEKVALYNQMVEDMKASGEWPVVLE